MCTLFKKVEISGSCSFTAQPGGNSLTKNCFAVLESIEEEFSRQSFLV